MEMKKKMDNKVLVRVFIPDLEMDLDVYVPISKRIGNIISLVVKAVNELGITFKFANTYALYERETGTKYPANALVYNTNIRFGSELILL